MKSTDELKQLADQLSCPKDGAGIDIANVMHESNIGMTRQAIDALAIRDGDAVLELGHGSCRHLHELLSRAAGVSYCGLEISTLMQAEASAFNADAVAAQVASFHLYDGDVIPFPTCSFDQVLTVNTLYFWRAPADLLRQIHALLRPGGSLAISFADKTFMQSLPFTAYGFTLYDKAQVEALAREAGFAQVSFSEHRERIKSKAGDEVDRLFHVAKLARLD